MSKKQPNKIFMERLKQRRIELNMSQSDLENEFGFGTGTISQYERGIRYPNDIQSLANALGVYDKWLSGESDVKDWQESIQSLVDSLKSDDSIKKNLEIFQGFEHFINNLGYKLDLPCIECWCISTSNSQKYASAKEVNSIISEIIEYTYQRMNTIKNDSKLEKIAKKRINNMANVQEELLSADPTYKRRKR